MDKYLSRNVLVVDDDIAIRRLVAKTLKTLEVENVIEAGDGNEALAQFRRNKLDLILLDWGMPGKSGLEVLRAIRATPSDVPIVMVTAERTRERVIEAAEAGCTDYLVKPLESAVLKEKLARYCQRKINTTICRCHNVMKSDVVTIKEDATVDDAIALLLQHNISGLPVVDERNHLLGIVTEYNLMQSVTRPDLKSESVKSIMTASVITVDEDTIPLKVVGLMQKHHIRRIPVVRNDVLVGVIARRDLLQYVTEYEEVLRGFLDEMKALTVKQQVI